MEVTQNYQMQRPAHIAVLSGFTMDKSASWDLLAEPISWSNFAITLLWYVCLVVVLHCLPGRENHWKLTDCPLQQAGFNEAPPIEADTVRKMGLSKVKGLNVVATAPKSPRNLGGRQGGDYRSQNPKGRGGAGGRGRGGAGGRGGGEDKRASMSRGPSSDRFDSLVEGSGGRGPYGASRRGEDSRRRD